MKNILLLPLFFIIALILTFLVIGGLVYLYFQVSSHAVVSDTSVFTMQFMFILNVCYLPTLFIATILTFVFINRRKAPALFSILVICGLFFVFMLFVYPMLKPGAWQQETPVSGLAEKKILSYEKFSVFTEKTSGHDLDNVIIYDKTAETPPRLSYKRYGNIKDNTIYTGSSSYIIYPTSQLSVQALSAPTVLTSLTRDTVFLSDNLNTAKEQKLFLAVIASYLLFVLAGFMVSRMTRWPLLNYLLVVFSLRLFLYLQSILYNKTIVRIFKELKIKNFADRMGSEQIVILLILTLGLCLGMAIFYLIFRTERGRQEMADE